MRRADSTVTLELLPDTFPDVNAGGTYELYESIPWHHATRPELHPGGGDDPGQRPRSYRLEHHRRRWRRRRRWSRTRSIEFTVSLEPGRAISPESPWTGSSAAAARPRTAHRILPPASIPFPAGETAQTISVPITVTARPGSPDRTFTVTLSNPVNAVFSGGCARPRSKCPAQGSRMATAWSTCAARTRRDGSARHRRQPDGDLG